MRIKVSLYLVVLLALVGCIETIPFDNSEYEKLVVVSGKISTAPGPYTINLSYSSPLVQGQFSLSEKISGAVVKIIENSTTEYICLEVEPGVYLTDENLRGKIGSSYQVVIKTEAGETIESTNEVIVKPPKIENVYSGFELLSYQKDGVVMYKKMASVFVDTNFPTDCNPCNVKWDVRTTYEFRDMPPRPVSKSCYVPDVQSSNNPIAVSSKNVANGKLKDQLVFTKEVDFKFFHKYGVMVLQESLSNAAYTFFERVREESERTGSIFERPPARIIGNMKNVTNPSQDVLGLFYATTSDTTSIMILGSDVGGAPRQCEYFQETKPICEDCSLIPYSSLSKPDYWY